MGKVAETQVGEILKMDVLKLRPTQFAVGMRQVEEDLEKMRRWSKDRLRRTIQNRPIPGVIGPRNQIYIVDHHHLASALYRLDERGAWVEILEDLSDLSMRDFWKRMERHHWVHRYDHNGVGPRACHHIPKSIAGLVDDPFRSVAWKVRKKGGYFRSSVPFGDFEWANFFRERLKCDPVAHFKKAVREALKLAESEEAQGLPGYVRFTE
jgi:hypothetical protein